MDKGWNRAWRVWRIVACMICLSCADVGVAGAAFDCTIEPKRIAHIGSPAEGVIEELRVERGDLVEKGQVLAVLESRTEALAVELARIKSEEDVDIRSSEARLGFQRAEKERAETLSRKQILSDKLMDEAAVQEKVARLEVESARLRHALAKVEYAVAQAQLDRRTLRSSVSGVITEVSKVPGEYIHEQAPLLTVAQLDELYVEVYLPVAAYGRVTIGQSATVEPVQPIGGSYVAQVAVVDRVFDAASGTFGVRLVLPNPDSDLPAGIRCTVSFDSLASGSGSLAGSERRVQALP